METPNFKEALKELMLLTGKSYVAISQEMKMQNGIDVNASTIARLRTGDIKQPRFDVGIALLEMLQREQRNAQRRKPTDENE